LIVLSGPDQFGAGDFETARLFIGH
jgi:hypothetical protein